MKKTTITLLIIGITIPLAYAGVGLGIKCSNDECGFEAEYDTGAGKASTAVSGYCVECKKMVTTRHQNGKSNRIAQVWDSHTGRTFDLHECPHCRKPFAASTPMSYCPKCNKKSIESKITKKWD